MNQVGLIQRIKVKSYVSYSVRRTQQFVNKNFVILKVFFGHYTCNKYQGIQFGVQLVRLINRTIQHVVLQGPLWIKNQTTQCFNLYNFDFTCPAMGNIFEKSIPIQSPKFRKIDEILGLGLGTHGHGIPRPTPGLNRLNGDFQKCNLLAVQYSLYSNRRNLM